MTRRIEIGIFGLGAFGRLMATTLSPYFRILVCDPAPGAQKYARRHNMEVVDTARCAAADYVILAVPVQMMAQVADRIAPLLHAGTTVIDVASVKLSVARMLVERLPAHVDILCTHPLFGPQSARHGVAGHRIALCPVRCRRVRRIEQFLTGTLELQVVRTTPETHDQDMAVVQGLTHLIARALREMGPLPTNLTTKSFALIAQAVDQVGRDSQQLFDAIEHENPFAAPVRERFLDAVARVGRKAAETKDGE